MILHSRLSQVSSILLLFFTAIQSFAGNGADSLTIWNDEYKDEIGFFKKAYRDETDPTFMFTDNSGAFSVGIGGKVLASSFFDFGGSIDSPSFKTSMISIPTDNAQHFGFTSNDSNIYVKARGQYGKLKIAAYLEFKNDEETIKLSQAYVSLGHFTIGTTYSFFEDLQAGVRTVDLRGPNTQVSKTHPLIGYTNTFGKGFKFGLALEQPEEITSEFASVATAEYNRYPDVAAFFKHSGKLGHIQISGVFRELSYVSDGFGLLTGKSFYRNAYGLSISGSLKPVDGLTLTGQAVGGRGISTYIKEMESLDNNMVLEDYCDSEGYAVLSAAPIFGGYVGASYRFNERFEVSSVFGYCQLKKEKLQYVANNFKNSFYTTVSIFYFLGDNCMAGVEYANGKKVIYDAETDYGVANRLNACFLYRF